MTTTSTVPTTGAPAAPAPVAITIDNTQKTPVGPSPAPPPLTSVVNVTLKSPPAAGNSITFGVTVTDTLGQTSTLATATVNVQAVPAVTLTPASATVAQGAPIELTATQTAGGTLASYNWTLQSVTPPKG